MVDEVFGVERNSVKPMYCHCVEMAPKKTTTYTMTAHNAKGETKSVSLAIQVR